MSSENSPRLTRPLLQSRLILMFILVRNIQLYHLKLILHIASLYLFLCIVGFSPRLIWKNSAMYSSRFEVSFLFLLWASTSKSISSFQLLFLVFYACLLCVCSAVFLSKQTTRQFSLISGSFVCLYYFLMICLTFCIFCHSLELFVIPQLKNFICQPLLFSCLFLRDDPVYWCH